MNHPAAETLQQQIPLLDYVAGQNWKPVRRIRGGRLMGLCPLHTDHQPSFLLDPNKNLFYCYGCGRGGDVIRFAEIYHGVAFREAIAILRRWYGMGSLLGDVAKFYQVQLHRHPEAVAYLEQRGLHRPELIEELRIGYAPGRCLRACPEIVLVEGLFDLAVLRQAGFPNVTCSIGSYRNGTQIQQLCDGAARTVYVAFDSDLNGSGQRAARQLAQRLWAHRIEAFLVDLPNGHDPNSFFVHGGGDAHQFQALLDRARS